MRPTRSPRTHRRARRPARRPGIRRTRAPAPRSGAALAELLVAVTLLVVGLLAAAGTMSRLARAELDARAAAHAAGALAERVERVAESACRDSSGVSSSRALVERWRTSRDSGVQRLVDSVRFTSAGRAARVAVLDVAVRCRP